MAYLMTLWNAGGVERGSILIAACALLRRGDTSRRIYIYDTFEGVPKPDERDLDNRGRSALAEWEAHRSRGQPWGYGGTVEMVREVARKSGYPEDKFIFVKGL